MGRRRNRAMRVALAVSDARRDEEAFLRARRFVDEDRRFVELVAASEAADKRCLAAIEELPNLRDGLNSLGRAA